MSLLHTQIKIPKKIDIEELIENVKKYCKQKETDAIIFAYEFAKKAHGDQTRKSGEPYFTHPLATALILSQIQAESNIIIAALLHDVPEDTEVTIEELEKNFGADIANMVKGITKLGKIKYRGVERYIENLRKLFVAMAEDIRVMIIKFADRIHNLSTLDSLPEKKRQRIAMESMDIYAPIANRLGMGEFKGLLEDLSFKYLNPAEYQNVSLIREKNVEEQNVYLKKVMERIQKELKESGIDIIDIHGREKQLYSLYQKLIRKNWEVDKIYDIVAQRIIVRDVGDCYATLGIIHKMWRPLKGRIKDFIAQPKPNGYQSLHTTVFCEDGKIVEFQIRTKEMHEDAEFGVSAHWTYDENGSRIPNRDLNWAKELAKMQQEILNNVKDLNEMKVDFFHNRIFVFTPKGDVIDLPEDATPVDFAYHIHTEVGNKCNGAKVNDQMVSLDTPLKNGDVVDIITDKNRKGPSPDWMKFVKTHGAKTHIKSFANTSKLVWIKSLFDKKTK
jgi:GTP pyrophosphokinase